jgi:hypothetical protein
LGIFAGPAVIAVFAALLRVYERTYVTDSTGEVIAVAPPPIDEPRVQRIDPLPQPELKKETP